MKFEKIVAFGDSWVWGDELDSSLREEQCWLGRLGKHYNLPTENFGWPGASLQSTIWAYLWWYEHEQIARDKCLILIGLTDSHRHSWYDPRSTVYPTDPPWHRFVHSSWVQHSQATTDPHWHRVVKDWYQLSDCDQLRRLNYQQAVLFFQGQDDRNLLQFCTLRPEIPMSASTLIWPTQGLRDLLDRPEWLAPNGHPNQLGHQRISELLIDEINRVILA